MKKQIIFTVFFLLVIILFFYNDKKNNTHYVPNILLIDSLPNGTEIEIFITEINCGHKATTAIENLTQILATELSAIENDINNKTRNLVKSQMDTYKIDTLIFKEIRKSFPRSYADFDIGEGNGICLFGCSAEKLIEVDELAGFGRIIVDIDQVNIIKVEFPNNTLSLSSSEKNDVNLVKIDSFIASLISEATITATANTKSTESISLNQAEKDKLLENAKTKLEVQMKNFYNAQMATITSNSGVIFKLYPLKSIITSSLVMNVVQEVLVKDNGKSTLFKTAYNKEVRRIKTAPIGYVNLKLPHKL